MYQVCYGQDLVVWDERVVDQDTGCPREVPMYLFCTSLYIYMVATAQGIWMLVFQTENTGNLATTQRKV